MFLSFHSTQVNKETKKGSIWTFGGSHTLLLWRSIPPARCTMGFGRPVVPELKRIHNGQLKHVLCQRIFPEDGSLPSLFRAPWLRKSCQRTQPLSHPGASAFLMLGMMITMEGMTDCERKPFNTADSFGRWGCVFALYLNKKWWILDIKGH